VAWPPVGACRLWVAGARANDRLVLSDLGGYREQVKRRLNRDFPVILWFLCASVAA
jgi:hypothetical protein